MTAKKACSFDGCGNNAHDIGLCAGHAAQKRKGKGLRPLFETRRRPGSPQRANTKCSQCSEPATKSRNQTYYCTIHYRIKQMRDDAKIDNKSVPSWEELLVLASRLVKEGMTCQVCGRQMNWLRGEGIKTVVTLQHDRSGDYRLICLSCNSRHQHCSGDSFYSIPEGQKSCTACKIVKPLAEFYRHKSNPCGVRSECKACSIASATARNNRRKNANPQRQPA